MLQHSARAVRLLLHRVPRVSYPRLVAVSAHQGAPGPADPRAGKSRERNRRHGRHASRKRTTAQQRRPLIIQKIGGEHNASLSTKSSAESSMRAGHHAPCTPLRQRTRGRQGGGHGWLGAAGSGPHVGGVAGVRGCHTGVGKGRDKWSIAGATTPLKNGQEVPRHFRVLGPGACEEGGVQCPSRPHAGLIETRIGKTQAFGSA